MIIVRETKIDYFLSSVLSITVSSHLHFFFYTFSLVGNIIVCTQSQGTNKDNYSYKMQHQRLKCHFWREINTFPSIPSLIRRVFSIFRRKMDGPNPSELDINVLIPAATFHLINAAPFPKRKTAKTNLTNLGKFMEF